MIEPGQKVKTCHSGQIIECINRGRTFAKKKLITEYTMKTSVGVKFKVTQDLVEKYIEDGIWEVLT